MLAPQHMILLHPTRPECPDASLLTGALSNAGTYADPQTPDLLRHRVFSSPCFGIFPPIWIWFGVPPLNIPLLNPELLPILGIIILISSNSQYLIS